MSLEGFLNAIAADPVNAPTVWRVLADWLEDQGDPRFELVRLQHQPEYRRDLPPEQRDARVRELLASGVQPVVPTIENSIGMRFVLIPSGTFFMGSPDGEGADLEHPRHEVEITRPFWMGAFQVTQEQYLCVMGINPSWYCSAGQGLKQVKQLETESFPLESVSWDETRAFCERLSSLPEEKKVGRTYRLPTEAEWEYSCRGGAISHTPFHFGNSLSSTQANFDGRFPHGKSAKGPFLERPSKVGSYPANAFGLFDMHGNVWDWCFDWFDENYYKTAPKKDPRGPENGEDRVLRGGSWFLHGNCCRTAYRGVNAPGNRGDDCGFRVCFHQHL